MIPFAEWRPDMPALGQWAREALNVVPAEESYRPLNELSGVSSALASRAQGAAWFRGTAGATKMFAGDASKLYLLSGSTWNDVSRTSGGPYAPGGDNLWRFTQFGTLAIAVNGVDAPQKFDLGVGTNWTALGGSPPVGTFITTVRDFVVMGKIGSAPQRVQWSGFNNAETWGTSLSTQADLQDLPDGGNVTGLVGGEVGLIFQETSVRRMTYEGPPVIFRIDKIANDIGASVPGSVAGLLDMAFFLHKSGFYMVRAGQAITPIGRGKVDRTFWAEFDEANHFRSSSAIDPVRGLYIFAYPANGQQRHAQSAADLQLAHRAVDPRDPDLRARVRRREPAGLHAGTARSLRHARDAALLARFVVLDGHAVAAAVRLRHVASQRLVLRTDALGHRGDGGVQSRRRPGQSLDHSRLPASDRRRQSADPDRRP